MPLFTWFTIILFLKIQKEIQVKKKSLKVFMNVFIDQISNFNIQNAKRSVVFKRKMCCL